MSIKQLRLAWPAYDPKLPGIERSYPDNMGYEVVSVTGSVAYKPGQFVSQAEASDLCEMTGVWRVTMVPRSTE
jgi:hypothetical protein